MHRHGYIGRKFGRKRDQRRALLKGLATSLVMHGKIETTYPKAKELVRYIEKLITKTKKGGLDNRRRVIAALSTQESAFRLFDLITPQLTARNSGHVRVQRTALRVGDSAQMASISFVDEIKDTTVAETKLEVTSPTKPAKKAKASPSKSEGRSREDKK